MAYAAKKFVAAFMLTLCCSAPGWAQGGSDDKPAAAGSMTLTTRAPEQDKWLSRVEQNGAKRVFTCKPLACPEAASVIITTKRSPTRNPDPKALEKLAKVDLPKAIRASNAARAVMADKTEETETIGSDVATLKGYPSVLNETKMTAEKKVSFTLTGLIFAGPAMITVESVSPSQELAKKNFADFLNVMIIKEGPARSNPAAPRTQTL